MFLVLLLPSMFAKLTVGEFLKAKEDAKVTTQLTAIVTLAAKSPQDLCGKYIERAWGDSIFENILENAEKELGDKSNTNHYVDPVPDVVETWLQSLRDNLALCIGLLSALDQTQPLFRGLKTSLYHRQEVVMSFLVRKASEQVK